MADYGWPDAEHRTLIGKRISRVDSPVKVSGQAKYTYDVKRPGMLFGKILRCHYAYAKVESIDASAAEKVPGVKAVHIIPRPAAGQSPTIRRLRRRRWATGRRPSLKPKLSRKAYTASPSLPTAASRVTAPLPSGRIMTTCWFTCPPRMFRASQVRWLSR